jgi:hypothetical protein
VQIYFIMIIVHLQNFSTRGCLANELLPAAVKQMSCCLRQ